MAAPQPLDAKILAAFKQACAEDRLDVADHLLRALETLDREPEPDTPVAKAYRRIAASAKGRPRLKRAH